MQNLLSGTQDFGDLSGFFNANGFGMDTAVVSSDF